jgi:hypothetical protein
LGAAQLDFGAGAAVRERVETEFLKETRFLGGSIMIEKPSPIFAKTYDFLLWLLNTTEKFPKSERFRRLRLYVRLSDERSLLKDNQYRYASEQLTEIGKLLGGWLKTLSNEKNRNRTYADRS